MRVYNDDPYPLTEYENNNEWIFGDFNIKKPKNENFTYKTFIIFKDSFEFGNLKELKTKSLFDFFHSFFFALKKLYDSDESHQFKVVIYSNPTIVKIISHLEISEKQINSENKIKNSVLWNIICSTTKIKYNSLYSIAIESKPKRAENHLLIMPKNRYTHFLDFMVFASYKEKFDFFRLITKIINNIPQNQKFMMVTNVGHLYQSQSHLHMHLVY